MGDKEINKKYYDDIANRYDKRHAVIIDDYSIKVFKAQLEYVSGKIFEPQQYTNFLDIGCGTGNILLKLLHMGVENAYGVDLSENMLSKCKENVRKNNLSDANLIQADVENLPFKNNTFDLVTCNSALHHFPDYNKVLSETYRILNSDGEAFILCEKNEQGRNNFERLIDFRMEENDDADLHEFSQIDIQNASHKAGFKNVEIKESDFVSFIYHKFIRKDIPEENQSFGYFLASKIDNILIGNGIEKYFVHYDIYLKKD